MVKIEIWDLFLKIWVLTALILTVVRGFQTQSFSTNFSKKYFLLKTAQNGSIREKKVVKIEIWEFRSPNGSLGPRLSHFLQIFKNEDLDNFFDLSWLDMVDIAYNDSIDCYKPFDIHWLHNWVA